MASNDTYASSNESLDITDILGEFGLESVSSEQLDPIDYFLSEDPPDIPTANVTPAELLSESATLSMSENARRSTPENAKRSTPENARNSIFDGGAPPEERESHIPKKVYEDIKTVENDGVTDTDMQAFINAAIEDSGIVGHNIEPYNRLLEEGLPFIVTKLFNIDLQIKNTSQDGKPILQDDIESVRIQFRFPSCEVGRPTQIAYPTGFMEDLYPDRARRSGKPYDAPVILTAKVTLTAQYKDHSETKQVDVPPFQVGRIPIMVGSVRCHTVNKTRATLKSMREDPNEVGGYFIVKGEYAVDLLENIRYNTLHIHAKTTQKEILRGEFLSAPGGPFENSSQIVIRALENGGLTIEVKAVKFQNVEIPFYIFYRLFGMTSDRDIAETVLLDMESDSSLISEMSGYLEKALLYSDTVFEPIRDSLDRLEVTRHVAEVISTFVKDTRYRSNDEAVRYLNGGLLSILDESFLPHMGKTPESRIPKLRFLGMLIHNIYLVMAGVAPTTNRDSLSGKRVHGPGISIPKAFKQRFNSNFVIPAIASLKRTVKNNRFKDISSMMVVEAFRNPLMTSDLDKSMAKAITDGNKEVVVKGNVKRINRVASQQLERKNSLNVVSTLRTISTHVGSKTQKQTKRADEMRRVHTGTAGYFCVSRSADSGEKVGTQKEIALSASVCEAGDAAPLRAQLLKDPAIIHLAAVRPQDILRENLAVVLINGEWIGCCRDAIALTERYRRLRREGRIVDPKASITFNPNPTVETVEFTLDVGRLTRPLLIVDNNIEEYDAAARKAAEARERGEEDWEKHRVKFVQNVRLTREHITRMIRGEIGLQDLIDEGVAEFISSDEIAGCYLARSVDLLRAERHNVLERFTHCDCQLAQFGVSAGFSPFGDHTQPARVTYETNQGRQTVGWYSYSWPHRADQNRFFQYYNEIPLGKTFSNRFVNPSGMNLRVALASYRGDNMEDSAILNKAAVDRGLFHGFLTKFDRVELEKGESFGSPDPAVTRNVRPNASYEKLTDGFPAVGAVLERGDIIIARYAAEQRRGADADSQYKFVDRSVVFKNDISAVVDAVWRPRTGSGEQFGVVRVKYDRPLTKGDKISTRAGNKNIAASLIPQSDMPFTASGDTADMIANPHSIPSRMTIGQMLEGSIAKVNARLGVISDMTSYNRLSPKQIEEALVANGFRSNGKEQMFDGRTGDWIETTIFMAPIYCQRLYKFVLDDKYAVGSSGPTDAVTGQPLEGRAADGGLRLGEMEFWGMESLGAMMSLLEKIHNDSDGREFYVCRTCGKPAIYNGFEGIYICKTCREMADICTIDSAKSSIAFLQEIMAANVDLRLGLKPRQFEVR